MIVRIVWSQGTYHGAFFKEEQEDGSWRGDGFYYFERLGLRTTVTYFDNAVSYRQTNASTGEFLRGGCLRPNATMPTMVELQAAADEAQTVEASSTMQTHLPSVCDGTEVLVVGLAEQSFIVCRSSADTTGAIIGAVVGDGFQAIVSAYEAGGDAKSVVELAPTDGDGHPFECEELQPASVRTRQLRATASRAELAPWWSVPPFRSHTRRLTGSKTCVFMHGAGVSSDGDVDTESFEEYWGAAHTYAAAGGSCGELKFIRRQTIDRAWDDRLLQEHFCDVAAGGHSGESITDTLVFSHSFGSLVVAGAIETDMCTFDTRTSKWFQIGGLWGGGLTNDALEWICAQVWRGDVAWQDLNDQMGFCTHDGGSLAWQSTFSSYHGIRQSMSDITKTLLHRNVRGGMCGNDAFGVSNNAALPNLRDRMALSWYSDGVVETWDCESGEQSDFTFWGTLSTSNFYQLSGNHLDSSCRFGNGVMSFAKPCNFFRYAD